VRENGGQYTHGAVWAAMAFAALGDRDRAWELWRMINPVQHTQSKTAIATYKAEPYVLAADLYARSPHIGRAGWSWYTGSAGWTYRLILESLLGLQRAGTRLHLAPCLPADWPEYKISYRYRTSIYHLAVLQIAPGAAAQEISNLAVDGVKQPEMSFDLVDDQLEHWVELRLISL
jgi:cellobiose phosphorylase